MATGGAPRRDGPVALSALFDDALRELVPTDKRLPVPFKRSISASVMVTRSFLSKPASKTTMALINLLMEAIERTLLTFFW